MATPLTRHSASSGRYFVYVLVLSVLWIHEASAWSFQQQRHSHARQHPQARTTGVAAIKRKAPLFAEPSVASQDSAAASTVGQYRRVESVEKYARLPVWPAWNGALIFFVSRVLGSDAAAKLEDSVGGRVCPNFFDASTTSPFIMLVHHCHSFAAWDLLRWFQSTFFPEGFPAHPHRGFVTLTYILEGGFVHRDSEGVRQVYGNTKNSNDDNDKNPLEHHSQWLFTGSGLLHEEMFWQQSPTNWLTPRRQELYQLWINVPAKKKMNPPFSQLVGPTQAPRVVDASSHSETLVLAGSYQNQTCSVPTDSPLSVFHVKLAAGAEWTYNLEELLKEGAWKHHRNANAAHVILYVQKGGGLESACGTAIPVHHTAFFASGSSSSSSSNSVVQVRAASEACDFMVLAGLPLDEPVVASGSMVMTSAAEINQAYADYQMGLFGTPWDHTFTDEEWQDHVEESKRRQ